MSFMHLYKGSCVFMHFYRVSGVLRPFKALILYRGSGVFRHLWGTSGVTVQSSFHGECPASRRRSGEGGRQGKPMRSASSSASLTGAGDTCGAAFYRSQLCLLVSFMHFYRGSCVFRHFYRVSGVLSPLHRVSGVLRSLYRVSGVLRPLYRGSGVFRHLWGTSGVTVQSSFHGECPASRRRSGEGGRQGKPMRSASSSASLTGAGDTCGAAFYRSQLCLLVSFMHFYRGSCVFRHFYRVSGVLSPLHRVSGVLRSLYRVSGVLRPLYRVSGVIRHLI